MHALEVIKSQRLSNINNTACARIRHIHNSCVICLIAIFHHRGSISVTFHIYNPARFTRFSAGNWLSPPRRNPTSDESEKSSFATAFEIRSSATVNWMPMYIYASCDKNGEREGSEKRKKNCNVNRAYLIKCQCQCSVCHCIQSVAILY